MPRRPPDPSEEAIRWALRVTRARGEGAPPREDKLRFLQETRAASPSSSRLLDDALVDEIERTHDGLREAYEHLEAAKTLLDQYNATPLHPAYFLDQEMTAHGPMALVASGSSRRVVALAEEMDMEALRRGDELYLSSDQSVAVAQASCPRSQTGEIATFERYTPDGRIILKTHGDESLVAEATASLDDIALRPGDQVRWERSVRLCLEKMDNAAANPYLLEEVEDIPLHRLGGQKENLRRILDPLLAGMLYPDTLLLYAIPYANTLLLYGPPGCGKTYMARIAASEVSRRSGKKARFCVVKASAWESPWVGTTQANITRCFESLRQAAQEGPAVLFIDEIEAVGRIRGYGGAGAVHSDKFLSTLLNELSGFQGLDNVTVIGATNRPDMLDAALRSRFSMEIHVRRPDMRAAREIFAIHLEEAVPYCPNSAAAMNTRQEIIEKAVSRLFAPNAGSEVCVLKLRDGKTRTVTARELVSGRLIRQTCLAAKQRAFRRHVEAGEPGVREEDIDAAVSESLERLTTTLSAYNAHNHLDDLAEDEIVVAVDPIVRRVTRPHRYVSAA